MVSDGVNGTKATSFCEAVLGSMSASSGFAGNSCLSVLFLSNLRFWFMKDATGSEFHVSFLGWKC